jgi:N-acyl-L-homoserine lactone synthetase
MEQQVIGALRRVRYKVLSDHQDLERIYRLRYACYRAEKAIAENERGIMTDPFDEAENCLHIAVEMEGDLMASLRLHLVSQITPLSPTLEVFPEILSRIENGETVLDPTRFVIDPSARQKRIPLHFLALRIPFLAAMSYNIDWALAPVRAEHAAFYRRYLGYEMEMSPRNYPSLNKPIQLLTADFTKHRDAVLARTPVFGPMAAFPEADIAFPSLAGVYAPSKKGRSKAA